MVAFFGENCSFLIKKKSFYRIEGASDHEFCSVQDPSFDYILLFSDSKVTSGYYYDHQGFTSNNVIYILISRQWLMFSFSKLVCKALNPLKPSPSSFVRWNNPRESKSGRQTGMQGRQISQHFGKDFGTTTAPQRREKATINPNRQQIWKVPAANRLPADSPIVAEAPQHRKLPCNKARLFTIPNLHTLPHNGRAFLLQPFP